MEKYIADQDWKHGESFHKTSKRSKSKPDVRHYLIAAVLDARKNNIMIAELHLILDELDAQADQVKKDQADRV